MITTVGFQVIQILYPELVLKFGKALNQKYMKNLLLLLKVLCKYR